MPVMRMAKCDICETTEAEADFGIGWKGWVQVSGIGNHVEGQAHKHADSNIMLCPMHGAMLAEALNAMQQMSKGEKS